MDKQYLTKRYLESLLESRLKFLVALFLVLAFGSVFAQYQYARAQTPVSLLSDTIPAPSVLQIDDNGNVLIRGQVESVDTYSMTITSWGGTWTVLTGGNTTVIPAAVSGIAGDTSEIGVGDFVGVEGVMATEQSFALYAALVRNWTTNPYGGTAIDQTTTSAGTADTGANPGTTQTGSTNTTNTTANTNTSSNTNTNTNTPATGSTATGSVNDTSGTESGDKEITYIGTVDTVNSTSLTFTDDKGSTYTVALTDEVVLVNDDDELITAADISVDDRIEMDGVAANGTISTTLIRNTSDDGLF